MGRFLAEVVVALVFWSYAKSTQDPRGPVFEDPEVPGYWTGSRPSPAFCAANGERYINPDTMQNILTPEDFDELQRVG